MKWICTVCGYIHEGPEPPAICPVCKVGREKFVLYRGERGFSLEHVPGAAAADPAVAEPLRRLLKKRAARAGLLLAAARAADREGYPEAAQTLERLSREAAGHTARLLELLGEGFSTGTRENLSGFADAAEAEARLAKEAAEAAEKNGNQEAYIALAELARDSARHGRALEGLLERYFS